MSLWRPNTFLASINPVGGLTDAMIAGEDGNGSLVLYGMRVLTGPSGLKVRGGSAAISCDHHNLCAIGQPEIVIEFADLTSKRAEDEAESWSPRDDLSPRDAEYDMFRTIRMVELTIQHHKGNDVGGKIDGVQLNRNGSMYWQYRKSNCPEN